MRDYRDLTIKARVTNKQIKVETVVLDTGMNAEEFRSFMEDLAEAIRIADDKVYAEYEEAKAEVEKADTKEALHDAQWKMDRAYEKWDKFSNLWHKALDLSDFGKEDENEEGGSEE